MGANEGMERRRTAIDCGARRAHGFRAVGATCGTPPRGRIKGGAGQPGVFLAAWSARASRMGGAKAPLGDVCGSLPLGSHAQRFPTRGH